MQDNIFVEDYYPISELITPEHTVRRPKFDVVDGHNHLPVQNPARASMSPSEVLAVMDEARITTMVNLTGGWGDCLKLNVEKLDAAYPGKFCTYCNLEWEGAGAPGWAEKVTKQLAEDVANGARGLKIFKRLGLQWKDCDGNALMPDDPRLGDVFEQCGELGIPVLIHAADPTAFFKPLDRFNERWDELSRHPDWAFYGPQYPSFRELIDALYRLIEAHPATTFITAHVGCWPENLSFVSDMLDRYPNFNTDISARIAELGRVPYSAREWFIKYSDRIIYGSDNTPNVETYRIAYRFLETADEYFPYSAGKRGGQGRFNIYGIHLPDDVLEKVYNKNFHRIVGV